MREAASEREEGRDREERSRTSYQGRRWEERWRREEERRVRKARRAGVAAVESGFEIGSGGGEAIGCEMACGGLGGSEVRRKPGMFVWTAKYPKSELEWEF